MAYNLDDVRILSFIRNRFDHQVRDEPQYADEIDLGVFSQIGWVKYVDEGCRLVLDAVDHEKVIIEIMKLGIPLPNSIERNKEIWSSKLGREMIMRIFTTWLPILITPQQNFSDNIY